LFDENSFNPRDETLYTGYIHFFRISDILLCAIISKEGGTNETRLHRTEHEHNDAEINNLLITAEGRSLKITLEIPEKEMTQPVLDIPGAFRYGNLRNETVFLRDHPEILLDRLWGRALHINRCAGIQAVAVPYFAYGTSFCTIFFDPIRINDLAFHMYSIYVYAIFGQEKKERPHDPLNFHA
ncbi:MAG: hypothetical protein IJQ12_08130, partial [Lachnospiraceae bacterium]|nr:hypothetical protein [Lachnospiraceae bacterium]